MRSMPQAHQPETGLTRQAIDSHSQSYKSDLEMRHRMPRLNPSGLKQFGRLWQSCRWMQAANKLAGGGSLLVMTDHCHWSRRMPSGLDRWQTRRVEWRMLLREPAAW